MSSAANAGAGLPTVSSRFKSVWTFCLHLRIVLETREQRVQDLPSDAELALGDGGDRERIREADGELLLIVRVESLDQHAVLSQSFVEPTGLGSAHRQDDLGQRLDRSIGIGLEVLPAQLFGLGEPVVLDGLVEERGVGLVAIVGLGILVEVLGQIV